MSLNREELDAIKARWDSEHYLDHMDVDPLLAHVADLQQRLDAVQGWVDSYSPEHGAYVRYDQIRELHALLAGSASPEPTGGER